MARPPPRGPGTWPFRLLGFWDVPRVFRGPFVSVRQCNAPLNCWVLPRRFGSLLFLLVSEYSCFLSTLGKHWHSDIREDSEAKEAVTAAAPLSWLRGGGAFAALARGVHQAFITVRVSTRDMQDGSLMWVTTTGPLGYCLLCQLWGLLAPPVT